MTLVLIWLGAMACAAGRVVDCGEPGGERALPGGQTASPATYGVINGYQVLVYTGGPERNGGVCDVKSGRFMTGEAGFREASKGLDDPAALARLAIALLERDVAGFDPWLGDAANGPPPTLGPTPPVITGDVLHYWRRHPQVDAWVYVNVRLADGTVTARDQMELLAAREDPLDRLKKGLADPDAFTRTAWLARALDQGSPEARALFAEAARGDEAPMVRKEAVRLAGDRKPEGAAALLAERLANDPSAEIRTLAATMLGRVGGPEARPALEAAAKGDADPGVRAAAEGALSRMATP